MRRVLCYEGYPIAFIEVIRPNNALGTHVSEIEGELCCRISPDEGNADIVDVTDEEAAALLRGEPVMAVAESAETDDED